MAYTHLDFSLYETELKRRLCTVESDLLVLETVDSTNSYLKREVARFREGAVIIAEHQSSGRGRVGRSFFSPRGTGLYMSILLRPRISAKDALLITTCAAVCTAEAIEAVTGADAKIKWVNDIFVNGKKVCGILTEAPYNSQSDTLDYAVLGIGVDVFAPKDGFGELESTATALFPYSDNTAETKALLATEIYLRFMDRYSHLSDNSFFSEYQKRLFILGEEVDVIKNGEKIPATVTGLTPDYSLSVRYGDGAEEYISSGEVAIKANTYSKFTEWS